MNKSIISFLAYNPSIYLNITHNHSNLAKNKFLEIIFLLSFIFLALTALNVNVFIIGHNLKMVLYKVLMQGKLFPKCTHFLYCSVLSQPDMESIFTKIIYKYSGHRKLLCELSKLSKFNAFSLLEY